MSLWFICWLPITFHYFDWRSRSILGRVAPKLSQREAAGSSPILVHSPTVPQHQNSLVVALTRVVTFFTFSDIQGVKLQHTLGLFFWKMKQSSPASSHREQILGPKQNTEVSFPFPFLWSLFWSSVAIASQRQNYIISHALTTHFNYYLQ